MSAEKVRVEIPGAAYDVLIGPDLIADIGSALRALSQARRVALITDTNVASRYGARADALLASAGFDVTPISLPAGEASKNWALAGEILEALASAGLDRDDMVVSLGGGVVGDIAGFVAAVYLRGIGFAQVPTTLLAMVDSSVGGKTAVDLSAGKNLAGAFKQPLIVIADTDTLSSLPEGEWKSGLAEAAKSAVLDGEEFARWLESATESLTERQPEAVDEAVRRCVRFKASIVVEDERESGRRECLNYGHTLGHAIETVAGYGVFTHGAAVAEGMRFAARVSADVHGSDASFALWQDGVLDALGLPALDVELDARRVLEVMHSDKKSRGGVVRMVLADGPGRWTCEPVPDAVVRAHLDAWLATKGKGQS